MRVSNASIYIYIYICYGLPSSNIFEELKTVKSRTNARLEAEPLESWVRGIFRSKGMGGCKSSLPLSHRALQKGQTWLAAGGGATDARHSPSLSPQGGSAVRARGLDAMRREPHRVWTFLSIDASRERLWARATQGGRRAALGGVGRGAADHGDDESVEEAHRHRIELARVNAQLGVVALDPAVPRRNVADSAIGLPHELVLLGLRRVGIGCRTMVLCMWSAPPAPTSGKCSVLPPGRSHSSLSLRASDWSGSDQDLE